MKVKYQAELTDTFVGEANYSWVKRVQFMADESASERVLVRMAKKLLGYTNYPCTKYSMGDVIELRPHGECTVIFIDYSA
jgi:hypothetical protein